jgi:hypothetical protein
VIHQYCLYSDPYILGRTEYLDKMGDLIGSFNWKYNPDTKEVLSARDEEIPESEQEDIRSFAHKRWVINRLDTLFEE